MKIYDWNEDLQDWENVIVKVDHYFSQPTSTSLFASKTSDFKIYPNPANNFIQLERASFSTIELYNVVGEKVLNEKIDENELISISHLKSGVYFYKIISKDNIETGKLLIEK